MSRSSTDYATVHAKRYQLSLEWLMPLLTPGVQLLDTGGGSPFHAMLQSLGHTVGCTRSDLRYRFLTVLDEAADVVLCMEVFEHLADRDGLNAEWAGSGTSSFLSECFRVLKPGGHLFLTTPNAASITAIHHALRLAPPMIYRPHVREYAPYELDELVRQAGFVIDRRETHDVWLNAIAPAQHKRIQQFIAANGYPRELRGEDIFLLAHKPA